MPRTRTDIQRAAGKLTSAIQKEWCEETGEPEAEYSEEVMNRSHAYLKAKTQEDLRRALAGKSVSEYLGEGWIAKHPSVKPFIQDLESWL